MAPRVGFEPTTYRLTAGCSTAELSGNMIQEKYKETKKYEAYRLIRLGGLLYRWAIGE